MFKDTKGVFSSRKSKKDRKKNNVLQNIKQKTKDLAAHKKRG